MHAESEHERRGEVAAHAKGLLKHVAEHLPLDAAADQLAAAFLQQRLPPPPPAGRAAGEPAPAGPPAELGLDGLRVQLRGPGLARLVVEDDSAVVYHCLANERRRHAQAECSDAEEAGPGGSAEVLPAQARDAGAGEGSGDIGVAAGAESQEAKEHMPGRLVFPLAFAPALEQLLAAPCRYHVGSNEGHLAGSLALGDVDLDELDACSLQATAGVLCREGVLCYCNHVDI